MAISILMTDVGVLMCWRQFQDVGDSFDRFRHKHFLSFNIMLIYRRAPTSKMLTISECRHHHPKIVTNIT